MEKPKPRRDFSVLIATGRLTDWAGSEVITVELTEELAAQGGRVSVYAHCIDAARREALLAAGALQVTSNPYEISVARFDVVYSQQNALTRLITPSVIDEMQRFGPPFFVFAHLSSFIEMEAPLSRLERELADVVVANSEETKAHLEEFDSAYNLAVVVPNPVPRGFMEPVPLVGEGRRRILIVSNHIPPELATARQMLIQRGWTVDVLGKDGVQAMIQPQMLMSYATVISIGKTVQMALLAGRAIYCYDHFGGPGWLTYDNFETAAKRNFSGRCTPTRKTSAEIVDDIEAGPSVERIAVRRSIFSQRAWVRLLLKAVHAHERLPLDDGRIAELRQLASLDTALSTICVQAFDSFHHWLRAEDIGREVGALRATCLQQQQLIEKLSRLAGPDAVSRV